jgi:hypothetical protein
MEVNDPTNMYYPRYQEELSDYPNGSPRCTMMRNMQVLSSFFIVELHNCLVQAGVPSSGCFWALRCGGWSTRAQQPLWQQYLRLCTDGYADAATGVAVLNIGRYTFARGHSQPCTSSWTSTVCGLAWSAQSNSPAWRGGALDAVSLSFVVRAVSSIHRRK